MATKPYFASGPRLGLPALTFIVPEHTPDNQKPGRVESRLEFAASVHPKAGWVSFNMEEITTWPSGKMASRSISCTMEREQADRFAAFLLAGTDGKADA
jgi:hypothetical protein